jgi:murein DD-endopeptidase MepM/ murein hydrolase activator NlpD
MLQYRSNNNSGNFMRLLLMLWFVFLTLWSAEGSNGKSLIITLPSPSGTVIMGDRNISVLLHPADKTKGIAVIPIDYYTPAGDINISWVAPGSESLFSINIQTLSYPTETLSVDPALVTPPPEAMERIAAEKAQAEAIYGHFTPIRYWNRAFIKPLDTNITSEYGSARTYNGSLKSYHGGVDFRARTPIPIVATNDGIVVLAQERYYSGGTIIIDHGEGIYSCYFHLSRFDVNVGDRVIQGQPIALSGDSGRITGPHLHFGMMVHGIQSDPLDLISQFNALFPKDADETLTLR